jgi:hypothetical protein
VGADRNRQPARHQSGNAKILQDILKVECTAPLPDGTSVLRRTGNSSKNTTNVRSTTRCSITNTAQPPPHISAFSTPNGPSPNSIQNVAVNRHQICHSTDEPNDISVDKTKDEFRDPGNETTKLTQLSANADTNRINSTGASSKTLQERREISQKWTAESVERSQNTVGESSETTADVTSGYYLDAGESANVTQHSQQSASTRRGGSKDPSVHSPNTSQISTRESAKRCQHSNTNPEPTARQNIYEHLRGQATAAQDCVGSSGKGPNRAQRPDGETRRKREDVNETRDKREYKTRTQVIDPAEERKRKVDCSACGTRGSAEGIHAECRAQIRQDGIKKYTRVQDTSGQNNINHPDIKDEKKVDYSSDDNAEQVENPASVKNKGIQRFSNGKLKRTDGVSVEKRETGSLTEYSAGNKGETREGAAEQVVGSFATVQEEQDSSTMSRRPQVLKITDSTTTAFRRRDGNKHVSFFSSCLAVTMHPAVLWLPASTFC